jgi:hypothetical protein
MSSQIPSVVEHINWHWSPTKTETGGVGVRWGSGHTAILPPTPTVHFVSTSACCQVNCGYHPIMNFRKDSCLVLLRGFVKISALFRLESILTTFNSPDLM